MDVSLAPKLLAAALVGAAVSAPLRSSSVAEDSVSLKLEWIDSAARPKVENLVVRATVDGLSVVRKGMRTVEATPTFAGDGTYFVDLKIDDAPMSDGLGNLTTRVHCASGETVLVLARTRREGRTNREQTLFLTVRPVQGS